MSPVVIKADGTYIQSDPFGSSGPLAASIRELKELRVKLADFNSETVLDEAKRAVFGQRQEAYGHPADNFALTAKLWSPILGTEVSPEKVGLCMIALKLARCCHAVSRDGLVDIAGYAAAVARALHLDP